MKIYKLLTCAAVTNIFFSVSIIDSPSSLMALDVWFFIALSNLQIFAKINFTNLQIVLIILFPMLKVPSVNDLTKRVVVLSKNLKIDS